MSAVSGKADIGVEVVVSAFDQSGHARSSGRGRAVHTPVCPVSVDAISHHRRLLLRVMSKGSWIVLVGNSCHGGVPPCEVSAGPLSQSSRWPATKGLTGLVKRLLLAQSGHAHCAHE